MDEEQLLELKDEDEVDDKNSLCEIGNILSKDNLQKMVVQSQEKYLDCNIKEIQQNILFQQKLLTAQNNCAFEHECLQNLDYIFQRSLMSISNKAQFEIILHDKVITKQADLAKISEQFDVQFNEMLLNYKLLRERKAAKCELYQEIRKRETMLQKKKDMLQLLEEAIFTKKRDVQETIEKTKRSKQLAIVKFAELVHVYKQENEHRLQLTKNDKIKKQLEGDIQALQNTELVNMVKPIQNNNLKGKLISESPIGKILSLASLTRSGSATNLNAKDLQSQESFHQSSQKYTIRKDTKYSQHVSTFNTSFTKNSSSFSSAALYENLPYLKAFKSTKRTTTSRYFESSICLKSAGTKQRQSTVTFLEKSHNDNINNSSTMNPELSKPTNTINENLNEELLHDYENTLNNPEKKVQFSSEINKSYFGNEQVEDPATETKIDVINIIREDIVRSRVQAKISEPKIMPTQDIAKIQMNNDELEFGNNYSFLSPTYSQYLGVAEVGIPIDPSENDDTMENCKEDFLTNFKLNK